MNTVLCVCVLGGVIGLNCIVFGVIRSWFVWVLLWTDCSLNL